MTPTPQASPVSARPVCRATRLWCAVADASRSTHVAECDACQRHFAEVAVLSSALRAEAGVTLAATDATAAQRTCRAVRDAHATASVWTEAPRGSRWRFPALAGVAAVTTLLVTTILIRPELTPPASAVTTRVGATESAPVSAEAALLVEALQSWTEKWSESVLPSAGHLAANNALQKELSSVYADARAALDFLAMNFLPPQAHDRDTEPRRKSPG